MESDVLVFDKPTSGLDRTHAQAVIQMLKTLNAQGKTIIFSTHDANLACELADSGYILNNVYLHGLGENSVIQQMFVQHINHAALAKTAGHTSTHPYKLRNL